MHKVYCNNCKRTKPVDGSSTMLAPNWLDGVWLVCRDCRVKLGQLKPRLPIPSKTDDGGEPYANDKSPLIGFGIGGTTHNTKHTRKVKVNGARWVHLK